VGSPYRDPRVLVALAVLTACGIALIALVNATTGGAARTAATVAIALGLWAALMIVLRLARRG
jgi:hypothetical protein